MLEMKPGCESCGVALSHTSSAWICSYECTWCSDCAEKLEHICPNCGGDLQQRPHRHSSSSQGN